MPDRRQASSGNNCSTLMLVFFRRRASAWEGTRGNVEHRMKRCGLVCMHPWQKACCIRGCKERCKGRRSGRTTSIFLTQASVSATAQRCAYCRHHASDNASTYVQHPSSRVPLLDVKHVFHPLLVEQRVRCAQKNVGSRRRLSQLNHESMRRSATT